MTKTPKTFRLDDKIYEILIAQAKRSRRSQAGQIEYLVEQEENKSIRQEKKKTAE